MLKYKSVLSGIIFFVVLWGGYYLIDAVPLNSWIIKPLSLTIFLFLVAAFWAFFL